MPWILVHNGDEHGTNMALAITPLVVDVIQVEFVRPMGPGFAVFSPASLQALRLAAATHGPLDIIWAGHGNTPAVATVNTGTPLTNAPLKLIAAASFSEMMSILQPSRVIFFTCSAGIWLQNNAGRLTPLYSVRPVSAVIYALPVKLTGILRLHVKGYLEGTKPDPLPPSTLLQFQISGNRLRPKPLGVSSLEWGRSYTPSGAREI